MTLKIEPFKRLYFYHFNCSPNIEQYEKIVTWERNEKIMVTDGEGIATDYHFACRSSCDVPHLIQQRHYLWNDYIDICCGDKMQEMLKLPEMIKLRTEAGVDLDTQKFILLEGGN